MRSPGAPARMAAMCGSAPSAHHCSISSASPASRPTKRTRRRGPCSGRCGHAAVPRRRARARACISGAKTSAISTRRPSRAERMLASTMASVHRLSAPLVSGAWPCVKRVAELIEERHGAGLGVARLVAGRHRDELRAAKEAAPLGPPPDAAAIGPELAVAALDPQAELVAGGHHGAAILDEQAVRHLDHRIQSGAAPIVAAAAAVGVGEHGHRLAIEQIAEAVEVMDRDLGDERLLDLCTQGPCVALGWSRRSMQSARRSGRPPRRPAAGGTCARPGRSGSSRRPPPAGRRRGPVPPPRAPRRDRG